MGGRGGYTIGFIAATIGLVVARGAAWGGAVIALLSCYLAGLIYVEWCRRQAADHTRGREEAS